MTITAIKERPILFSGPMVRALLDGRKTMTRRVVKPQLENGYFPCMYCESGWGEAADPPGTVPRGCRCTSGAKVRGGYWPGDRLYVKEALFRHNNCAVYDADYPTVCTPVYDPDEDNAIALRWKWKREYLPSMFMPKFASRITLEVTSVTIDRLQDISEADAQAEGTEPGCLTCGENCTWTGGCGCCRPSYRDSFINLWHEINGKESWEANPFVWVIEFKRVNE